jgi:hypothetical protein
MEAIARENPSEPRARPVDKNAAMDGAFLTGRGIVGWASPVCRPYA